MLALLRRTALCVAASCSLYARATPLCPLPDDALHTSAQYFSALRAADSLTFTQQFEYDFRLLLEARQLQVYDSLPTVAGRKEFITGYWRAVNPAPLLPDNDRLVDHLRRRLYVRKHFAQNQPPYFDARGQYYLKYGKPSVRHEDPGGLRRVAFFNSANYDLMSKRYSRKGLPEQYYTVIANETWAYENVAHDFVVHFIKTGTGFREIASLSEVIANRHSKDRAWQLSDLIKQRAAVSPVLGRTSMAIEQFEVALQHGAGQQRRDDLFLGEMQSPAEHIIAIARDHEREAELARLAIPASAHEPVEAVNRVKFTEFLAQFRGPNGHNRVEIALCAPIKKNFVEKVDSTNADTLFLEFAALLRNEHLEELGEQRERRAIPIRLAALENLSNAAGHLSFLASPQPLELFLQVQDRISGRIGFSRHALTLRDFSGKDLALSDLQLYAEVQNEKQSSVLPIIKKENLALAPYPYPKIRKQLPLYCYFEIYNLRSAGIAGGYEINYRVCSDLNQESLFKKFSRLLTGAKASAVSMSHAQAVTEDTSQELIAIDLGNLASGAYRLEITVTSVESTNLNVRVTREIEVED